MESAAMIAAMIASTAVSVSQQQRAESNARRAQKKIEERNRAAPVPKLEEPGTEDLMAWMRKRKGRAGTILAGDLVPMDTGKKTLLG